MKTVCLVMIVRDEAAVIARCLRSVKPWIDTWVICDTGSTEETPEVVARELSDLPGTLYRIPWTNFEETRTEGMRLARGSADYHLLMDADMTLRVTRSFATVLTLMRTTSASKERSTIQ